MPKPLTRSASLTGFADLARSLGLDPYRLLAEQRIPVAALTNPDLRIPSSAVGGLLERSSELSGALDFGLRLAEARKFSNLGAVAFVLREQPTVRKVIEAMIGYVWVQNQALTLGLSINRDIAVLRLTANVSRQGAEATLGVLVRTIRSLVGESWRPLDVSISHPRPADIRTWRRVFGVTPLFGQEFDGIVIDARDLDREIAGADPVAARRAERYVELEAGAARQDPVATARDLINVLLPTGTCSVERVAAHMGISRRTLHRELAAANGTTFKELLDEVRVELAHSYITSGRHSLSEIAERLGYSSLSAFSRWRRTKLPRPEGGRSLFKTRRRRAD